MGDSPSLNFMPSFNESYDEDIFTQFSNLTYVLSFTSLSKMCNDSILIVGDARIQLPPFHACARSAVKR